MMANLSGQWNEPRLVESRQLSNPYQDPEALRDALVQFRAANADEYYILIREPDFYEDLGILERFGRMDLEIIDAALGGLVVQTWDHWRVAVLTLRAGPRGGPLVYCEFERLAMKVAVRVRQRGS